MAEKAPATEGIVGSDSMNTSSSPPASPTGPKTILIIDDEVPFAVILAAGLEAKGYRTLQASNAATGWELAHAHRPDLILCDIDMPGKDGLRLLRDIRGDPALADRTFVLMTGKPRFGNYREAMDQGADDFLLKPFSPATLLSCVEARLQRAALSHHLDDAVVAHAPEAGGTAPTAPDPVPPGNLAGQGAPRDLTVLVIDDEAYFRKFVSQVLKKASISRIVEAQDGCEAVKMFQEHQPGLVLLDINMPHMNGLETLTALRRLSATVPIIMLTSISEEIVVEECVVQGASNFVRKDVPAQVLSAALGEALGGYLKPKEPTP
jgi:CheY-like chemotaxis protein